MTTQRKTLKMALDELQIVSCLSPVPIDEFDGSCPFCGKQPVTEAVTIVQHGFIQDTVISVFRCHYCYEAFHMYYTVECAFNDGTGLGGFNVRR